MFQTGKLSKLRTRSLAAVTTLLTALALGGLTPSVQAAVTFQPTGSGALQYLINGFDEAVGNAVAIGASGLGSQGGLQVGDEFTLLYQATITGLLAPGGAGNIIPTGLDTTANGSFEAGTYELTVVGLFREVVTGLTGATGTAGASATFALAPDQSGSYLKFFYDQPQGSSIPPVIQPNGVAASNSAGTGFAGGTLILEARPDPAAANSSNFTVTPTGDTIQDFNQSGSGTYSGVQTLVGSGSTSFLANVLYTNPAFFPSGGPPILTTSFNTSQKTPFVEAAPSLTFVIGNTPTDPADEFFVNYTPIVGPINGLTTGTDFMFQADANNSFSVVPEPGSLALALSGVGLASLGAIRARRRRTPSAAA